MSITPKDLLALDHSASIPVKFDGWFLPDGTPLKFVIRSLTFRERREAIRAATIDRVLDDELYAIESVWRGLVEPKLTRAQMDILWDLNVSIIDQLADAISNLGRLSPAEIRADLERLAGRDIPPAPDPAATASPAPVGDDAAE